MSISFAIGQTVEDAAVHLKEGKLVAIPTETVYGLGADATNEQAVANIFRLKGRPSFNPLITHFASKQAAFEHVTANLTAEALADAFCPGPLTLVLPKKKTSPLVAAVSAGLDTIGVRVPAHPITKALLELVALPIAAPSANPSEALSPTTAAHVRRYFSHNPLLAYILDGGPCQSGLESTVIGFDEEERAVILRPGGLSLETLTEFLGYTPETAAASDPITSPGQMLRHYAPRRAQVRLNALDVGPHEALLAFGPTTLTAPHMMNLSATGNLEEAASNLFAMLQELDASGAQTIAVMPIPMAGVGIALNDRLRRASVKNPSVQ
ncbi:MAG: threonylcarbamoyl-AMP synthase [Alphaproteobacteria bacterium]|nr:threonylcarbamoyl-AMP synthase [Alphaproteobacteria bacterium]